MKKFGLLLIPIMAMPFLVNCNHNTYHFKFIGNHCKINGRANFDANVTKNKSNVQYTITPDDGYQLDYLDDEYQEDFTLESNVLTILEMKQDYTITVNAIDENIAVTIDVDINPDTVKKVGFAFDRDDTITEIDWGDGVKNTEKHHEYTEYGLYLIVIKGDLTAFQITAKFQGNPDNIIGANIYSKTIQLLTKSFVNCSNLVSVNLPNEMTSIGDSTFANCTSLKSINLPKNLTSISMDDFRGCTSLTSIVIPSGVTIIEYGSFNGCSKLASIELPDSLLALGDGCFASCTSLVSINLPSDLIYIGNGCFQNCAALTSIVIPNSVIYAGSEVFNSCTSLASINIPINSDLTRIHDNFCDSTAIASIKIPNNITEIESLAFGNCPNLVLADLSEVDHVIKIGDIFGKAEDIREDFKIKVQANLVEYYKSDTYWSDYADFIEAA